MDGPGCCYQTVLVGAQDANASKTLNHQEKVECAYSLWLLRCKIFLFLCFYFLGQMFRILKQKGISGSPLVVSLWKYEAILSLAHFGSSGFDFNKELSVTEAVLKHILPAPLHH